MDNSRLAFLFQAYFNKTATPAERDELMELLEQSEHDEHVKSLLTDAWQQHISQSRPFSDRQGEEMLAAILQQGRPAKPVAVVAARPVSWLRRAVAAAAILLFMVAGGYFWFKSGQPAKQTVKNTSFPKDTIVPGGNKAVLTLANGSTIILDSTRQGTLTEQGNVKVVNLNTAVLAYNAGSGNDHGIIYNTLATPRGGQYKLLLADGTKVWLNASSSIRFPVAFEGAERNVAITGEAYFEVAPSTEPGTGKKMPFTVKIINPSGDGGTVQVLGTHFNIMAYEDESSMNTTLLEGSVKVSKGAQHKILTPGQELKIKPSGKTKIGEADIEEVMAWKNGWFQFNSYDIGRIMRQVSRWYDVDIAYEGKIPTGNFSGIVSRENNIAQVLKIMQAGGVGFKIDGRKITVYDHPH